MDVNFLKINPDLKLKTILEFLCSEPKNWQIIEHIVVAKAVTPFFSTG